MIWINFTRSRYKEFTFLGRNFMMFRFLHHKEWTPFVWLV